MEDKEFLIWLHERLVNIHEESPIVDYMHKLRAIIRDTPNGKISINANTGNDIYDLIEQNNIKTNQVRPRKEE